MLKKFALLAFSLWLLEAPTFGELTVSEIAQTFGDSVVTIVTLDEHDQPLGMGSGFFIDRNGLIATNRHVLEGSTKAIVKTPSGQKGEVLKVLQLDENPIVDLLVVATTLTETRPLSLGDSDQISVGQEIVAIGNPAGLEGTISNGIISGIRKISEMKWIQITASISPGSSGGPVFNHDGRVIGIATSYLAKGQNLNFSIPVNYLRSLKSVNLPLYSLPKLQKKVDLEDFHQEKVFGTNFSYLCDHPLASIFDGLTPRGLKLRGTKKPTCTSLRRLTFSLENGTGNTIKNVQYLVIYKNAAGDVLDYSQEFYPEKILPKLAKQIQVEKIIQNFYTELESGEGSVEVRVLTYDIERPSSFSFNNPPSDSKTKEVEHQNPPRHQPGLSLKEFPQEGEEEKEVAESPLLIAKTPAYRTPHSTEESFSGRDDTPMVLIPEGGFLMGSTKDGIEHDSVFLSTELKGLLKGAQRKGRELPENLERELPQHVVFLNAYFIDQYEVATSQYERFFQKTGREKPDYWKMVSFPGDKDKPVVGVNWYDAAAYCEWAGKRLPTEAEWERAARWSPYKDDSTLHTLEDLRKNSDASVIYNGTPFPWEKYEKPTRRHANFEGKLPADGNVYSILLPVGEKEAGKSAYGVYDMAGNVWEWVADWYEEFYYDISPERNPKGPSSGEEKVMRGGSWGSGTIFLRAAYRGKDKPTSKSVTPELFNELGQSFRTREDFRGSVRWNLGSLNGGPQIGFRCAQSAS